MYKIIGADGKEYGPVSLEQLKQWISQGRVNPQSRVQIVGLADWKSATEYPELNALFGQLAGPAISPPPPASAAAAPRSGLAITSFVLGLLSVTCLWILAGIPAIITGHIAHNRARRLPAQFGGSGFAIAGFILGYISLALTLLVLPAMLLPALSTAKSRAQSINCSNNLKQIGLAFKTWALDHSDQYPFNVSTNSGGSMELCSPGGDGFDSNGFIHFMVLSNELSTPIILVCPADNSKQRGIDFANLQAPNVTYKLHSGSNYSDANPQAVLAVCPIHGNELRCDGSVTQGRRRRP